MPVKHSAVCMITCVTRIIWKKYGSGGLPDRNVNQWTNQLVFWHSTEGEIVRRLPIIKGVRLATLPAPLIDAHGHFDTQGAVWKNGLHPCVRLPESKGHCENRRCILSYLH